jgi:hypothetical protein
LSANDGKGETDLGARAETLRSPGVFDRNLGLAVPEPQTGADVPPARKARVEGQRAIDQRHHRTDVFAEIRQHKDGIGKTPGSSLVPVEVKHVIAEGEFHRGPPRDRLDRISRQIISRTSAIINSSATSLFGTRWQIASLGSAI